MLNSTSVELPLVTSMSVWFEFPMISSSPCSTTAANTSLKNSLPLLDIVALAMNVFPA